MDISSFLWGAAIGVIGAFATGFLKKAGEDSYSWAKKKINPKAGEPSASHLIIHMNAESGFNTAEGISLSEPQRPVLERVSVVTLDEINTSLVDAPPLQRTRISESYVGLRVEWDTQFVDGKLQENGDIRLQLTIPNSKHQPKSVWCEVPASEYRELGILPENSKIRVSGKIETIASYGIYLKDARLHIYGMRRGA
jgi:hypothetical protein